jgi:hypothetical protein
MEHQISQASWGTCSLRRFEAILHLKRYYIWSDTTIWSVIRILRRVEAILSYLRRFVAFSIFENIEAIVRSVSRFMAFLGDLRCLEAIWWYWRELRRFEAIWGCLGRLENAWAGLRLFETISLSGDHFDLWHNPFRRISNPFRVVLWSTFSEHSVNIQWTFREHSGNIQGTCREHSGNIQGSFTYSLAMIDAVHLTEVILFDPSLISYFRVLQNPRPGPHLCKRTRENAWENALWGMGNRTGFGLSQPHM